MFKIVMIVAVAVVALGWVGYGVWRIVESRREKTRPKGTTEHLQKVRDSFEEYTKKIEQYERKNYDRKDLQR